MTKIPLGLMPRRRIAIVLAAFAAWGVTAPACAADNSALAFVTAIYNSYKGKDAKGIPLENRQIIRRYFEPQLAALMARDQAAAAKHGEVGLLDYDPFLEAQDWDTATFDIAVDDAGAGKAKATVKFVNEGEGDNGLARPRPDQEWLAGIRYYVAARRQVRASQTNLHSLT